MDPVQHAPIAPPQDLKIDEQRALLRSWWELQAVTQFLHLFMDNFSVFDEYDTQVL